MDVYSSEFNQAYQIFESERMKETKRISALRIEVPEVFKGTVDMFIPKK